MDYADERAEFFLELESQLGGEGGARVLTLTGEANPLIGVEANMPESGFG